MNDDRLHLTRSLEVDVRTGFASDENQGALCGSDLTEALANITVQPEQSLEQALIASGHEGADSEASAVLAWIDATFNTWSARYPMDSELQQALQRIRPLAGAFACQEERFFTPGAHALHRLLDTLHTGFSGWSGDLGKAARPALEAVNEVIQRCLQDFPSEPAVDHTLHLLEQKVQGHAGQLARLDAGLIEREIAAMAGTVARRVAGQTLGRIVGTQAFPARLISLISGDWFEAGTELVQNVGTESELWQRYVAITESLVRPFGGSPAESSQTQSEALRPDQLPSEVKLVLQQVGLSDDRAQSAASTLEYLLLRQASGQDAGALEPVNLDGQPASTWQPLTQTQLTERGVDMGDWYHIQQPEGMRRLRLAGGLAENAYLIFMDFTGARALRLSTEDFSNLLRSGEAHKLDTQQTFSRALVESVEQRQATLAQQATEQATVEANLAEQAAQDAIDRAQEREAGAQRLRDAEARATGTAQALSPANTQAEDQTPSAEQPFDRKTVLQLQIPIGTWLGFHDREPPIMARVAVRDLENDSYIFTNRDGIKLRELTVPQLVTLIERDMVDILEHKTSFRETLSANTGSDRLSQFQSGPA